MKTYSDMSKLKSFEERFKYLRLNSKIGIDTFGAARYLNQDFYSSGEWKLFKRDIVIRDDGLDLGVKGHEIHGAVYVHHINPITLEDIEKYNFEKLFDPENVVCCSKETHQALHYSDDSYLEKFKIAERTPNDTTPWKKDL